MIVNFKKENLEIEKTTDVLDDIEMTFDKDAMAIQFQMFINNIYSNPIGSIVREITSNAVDSHIEAGINEPVVVSLKQENGDYSISFIDYGIGMSPERVKIYSSFLSSTKRENNNEIGGWGVGGKSILAYKRYNGIANEYDNSYNITTRYDGTEYGYYIYEGQDRPIVTQLYKTETTETNGTEIKIPIDSNDINKFVNEIRRQLFYFDNVIYEGFEKHTPYNLNDFKIVEGENFIYRGYTYDNYIHVCLGNVAYPIDYSAIGVSRYDCEIPVAIKMPVGSIGVTVSRESLDYSHEAIELIKNKIEDVKKEIINLYNKNNEKIVTLKQYLDHNKTSDKVIVFDNDLSLNISNILNDNSIIEYKNFKYNDYIKSGVRSNKLFNIFTNTSNLADRRKKYDSLTIHTVFDDNVYLIDNHEETPSDRKINRYLKIKHDGYFRVVKKTNYDAIENSFLLSDVFYKDSITEVEFNEIQNDLFNEYLIPNVPKYSEVVYPEDFFKKAKIADDKRLINISVIDGSNINRIERTKIKFKTLNNFKGSVYYGTKEDFTELFKGAVLTKNLFNNVRLIQGTEYGKQDIFRFSNSYYASRNSYIKKSGIGFFMLSKVNVKKVENLRNFHHISLFKIKMLRRKNEALNLLYEKNQLDDKYSLLSGDLRSIIDKDNFKNINPEINLINNNLQNKIRDLKTKLNNLNVKEELIQHDLSNTIEIAIRENCSFDNISSGTKNIIKSFDQVITFDEKIRPYFNVIYNYGRDNYYWTIVEMINNKIREENNI